MDEQEVFLFQSDKDDLGRYQIVVRFKGSPMYLKQDETWIKRYEGIKIQKCCIYKVTSFIGWDRGDIGEAGVALFDKAGRAIYERSDHKEAGICILGWPFKKQSIGTCHFDAIQSADTEAVTDEISIHIDAWPTGINPDKHTMEKMARPDINLRLWCEGVCHE